MWTELRQALRSAAKRPGFAITVVLTLALGIGASTAVFTLINTIVLRPLPYRDADDLFLLLEQDSLAAWRLASYPTFQDWRAEVDAFEGMAFIRGTTLRYETDDRSGLLLGAFVTEDFFSTMSMPAALGRTLGLGDYEPDAEGVAVLSHAAWTRWFGGDSAMVGQTLRTGTGSFTIVGIMPPVFDFPDWGVPTHIWAPITTLPPADFIALQQRGFHADSRVIARVRPGQSIARGRAELEAVAGRLAMEYPDASGSWTGIASPSLKEITVQNVRPRLLIFGGAVAGVLLICCFNLANLYLAQGTSRRQEFAIRAALGAGRRRVMRQLFVESLLLAALGGALGVGMAVGAVRLIVAGSLQDLPRLAEVTVGPSVLALAFGLTAGIAMLFALAGAWRSGSVTLADMLGGRGEAGVSVRVGRLPGWLQSVQVSLTFVLLIAAAFLTQSFIKMGQQDLGFDPKSLIQISINPPSPTYDDAPAAAALYDRLLESVAATPGVQAVALVNHAPPSTGGAPTRAAIGGVPAGDASDITMLPRTVSAGYFSAMGIRILAGREFDDADMSGPAGPLIVNETMARRWGDASPIGQRLGILKASRTRPDFGEPLVGTIVGVVADITRFGSNIVPPAMVYLPYPHDLWPQVHILARTETTPATMLSAIEDAVRAVEPAIPVSGPFVGAVVKDEAISDLTAGQRFAATVVSGFAMFGLFLAAVGMYGLTAYTVALETRDIGVRLAIGATPGTVLRTVVARVARIAVAGLFLGVFAAILLTRFLANLLYDIEPTDPATFAIVAVVLMIVGTIAGYIPARRAARVDPIIALRTG